VSRVMTEPVPPLTEIVPGLSQELSKVVMRALERSPDKRFGTCAQFADALEAAATGRERIATPRELAAYVTEVLGDEVSAQREAVRAWIARSEPSQVGAPPVAPMSSSVSAAAMSLSGLDPSQAATLTQSSPPKGRSRVGLFLLLLLALGAVGGGSFLFARETGFRPPVAATPTAPATPATVARPADTIPEPAASDPSAMPLEPVAAPVPVKPVLQQRPRAAAAKATDSDSSAPKKTKKKSDDDVDLRNPYR